MDDGDTVTVLRADRSQSKVRLANIDAPETSHGRCKPGQPYSSQSTQLLAMLAPLVMGALGQQQRQQGLDAGGLARTLAGARPQAAQQSPAMGMLTQLLDADGDGSGMDELAEKGLGMLSGFLKK